ncbi:hypothetical protein [Caulobacter sp. S45]|uniref:hypothetical protein n=1 Tax=Caulobacter sp. S45 TaxID=1641861 RepID=UPI0015776292|nr:hypothetical protein [Caulobacter sp. S45]
MSPKQDYPNVLLAVVSAAGAVHDLIEVVQTEDHPDVDNAIGLFCDAIIALGDIEEDEARDGQLVAAAHKWIGENR